MPPAVALRPRNDGGRASLPPQPLDSNPPLPPPRHGSSSSTPIHMNRVPLPHIPQPHIPPHIPQREQPSPPTVQPRHARPQSTGKSISTQFGPGKLERDVRKLYHTCKYCVFCCSCIHWSYVFCFFFFSMPIVVQICF